jgi:rSAM/selenodomain-associated transferase 1
MTDTLVIVFVKNIKLGTVKTRLAKTIGDYGAFEVYSELVKITESATSKLAIDKRIYFSNAIVDTKWQNHYKAVQQGADLGERMLNAFKDGFEAGYKKIVLIGSDLPDINETHIKKGFEALDNSDIVFGPAEDGGYYLLDSASSFQKFLKTNLGVNRTF